ncbi:hypothetical protein CVU83_01160 [Candidatus Falkowbacteria bacterium HGW-Falkowbacteria-2]|uniref:DOD-type homing endonuclease domain-containing protein n=1 Tax=Candidatus Falkowbacteria bacterium HGW-Falkowbacteria-2 TaxID=2013769 RepID=A0A2N2E220_9BACT|nr:MAG: hypothetical protein CVU83_01160 [Candidatus Falkowbacteria bacterium HGW-Falkowbacteria-2]
MILDKENLAYVIGVAIGDGNLSNPNGRATRLRVTCDKQYQKIIERICTSLNKLLPTNKVSIINRAEHYCDISCYSNKWESWLGWKAGGGPKYSQNVSVPEWIIADSKYCVACLRGLLETDGSIYFDRGYKMINFVTVIPTLAQNVTKMITKLGYSSNVYRITTTPRPRFTIRIAKDVDSFIEKIQLSKD